MLNEVKHLVLRHYRYSQPGTRFFVALLLRMTLARNLSCRVNHETTIEISIFGTPPLFRKTISKNTPSGLEGVL